MFKRLLDKLCGIRMHYWYHLFFKGYIDESYLNEKVFFWITIRAKWVRDECHHLCILCDFKHECWSNAKEGGE